MVLFFYFFDEHRYRQSKLVLQDCTRLLERVENGMTEEEIIKILKRRYPKEDDDDESKSDVVGDVDVDEGEKESEEVSGGGGGKKSKKKGSGGKGGSGKGGSGKGGDDGKGEMIDPREKLIELLKEQKEDASAIVRDEKDSMNVEYLNQDQLRVRPVTRIIMYGGRSSKGLAQQDLWSLDYHTGIFDKLTLSQVRSFFLIFSFFF